MRLGNVQGRWHILVAGGGVDVEAASAGRFPAGTFGLLERWAEFHEWAPTADLPDAVPVAAADLGAPVPRPRQVFGIGMNYSDHADETGLGVPPVPSTFTKFPTCITGPQAEVALPPGDVDWEVELVVVIGRTAQRVCADDAWDRLRACASARTCPSADGSSLRHRRSSAWASPMRGSGPPGRSW